MQLGIIGLPKSGKTTLFNTVTSGRQATDKFSRAREPNVGVALVRDRRLERLRELYRPRRYTPATIEVVDVPGIQSGSQLLDLDRLRTVDALVNVVRAFADPEILHVGGRVDPARDLETVNGELILADHILVERRLERLEQARKRGLRDEEKREQALLAGTVLPALEGQQALRGLELDRDAERRLRGFQLLSAKPMLVVLNVDDDRVAEQEPESWGIGGAAHLEVVVASAPIEEEISRLDAAEQSELLAALGLAEPSVERLVRASYRLLGLVSFFTVGEDEVRAWTVRRGTPARQAAGVIHSDLERGFIRAEVVGCEDLLELGSLPACREQGRLRLEGKDYEVRDGDVMHVRFNV
jgi:hypothetical protein